MQPKNIAIRTYAWSTLNSHTFMLDTSDVALMPISLNSRHLEVEEILVRPWTHLCLNYFMLLLSLASKNVPYVNLDLKIIALAMSLP